MELHLTLEECFQITCKFVAFWGAISGLEWLANLGLFKRDGLLSWKIMGLRYGKVHRSFPMSLMSSTSTVAFVIAMRIVAAAALFFPIDLSAALVALGTIVFSCAFMTHRACFGGDGSDQMGSILTAGALILGMGMLANEPPIAHAGVAMIAGQATISYFTSGASKAASSAWRSGIALSGVMQTETYGHPIAGRIAGGSRTTSIMLCWTIILTETAFPLLLFAPPEWLAMGLAAFAFFHLSNGFFMGLNSFIPTFLGTYPAVIVANQVIRQIAG